LPAFIAETRAKWTTTVELPGDRDVDRELRVEPWVRIRREPRPSLGQILRGLRVRDLVSGVAAVIIA
jgi:hypothetical protein